MYKWFNNGSSVASSATLAEYNLKLDSGSINFSTGVQSFGSNGTANTWTGNSSFSFARSPYIQSQLLVVVDRTYLESIQEVMVQK